jgi:uncharacterized protein
METILRYFRAPKKSFFLFGPRGTGKSTWVRMAYPSAMIVDLLDPQSYRQYRSFPERLKELVLANADCSTFVIDEVQRAPGLLPVVHSLIEQKQPWLFILTGSSARKLKRTGVDLLAGRAQLKFLHPFMASEMTAFDLTERLNTGMVPLMVDSPDPAGDLKTYISLYMKEEVQLEGFVRRIEDFGRFLEAISFSQASVLNYSNIARDCGVSSKTVQSYVNILEDLLLSFRLPVFVRKAKRHMSQHPKFYFFDVGVYRAIRPVGPLDQPEEVGGHALETLVCQHLRAWLAYSEKDGELFFWRTISGLEVDFIIYGEIGFWAIEIKNAGRIHNADLRALREFKTDYPECRCMLFYRGKDRLQKGEILCQPVTPFLQRLQPGTDIS